MRIGVLGTGVVGRTRAGAFADRGHQVVVGTRDVDATMARSEPDQMGNPPFAVWAAEHADVRLGTFAEAAAGAVVVVNASSGSGSLDALRGAGAWTVSSSWTRPTRWTSPMASHRPCRSPTPTAWESRSSAPFLPPRS